MSWDSNPGVCGPLTGSAACMAQVQVIPLGVAATRKVIQLVLCVHGSRPGQQRVSASCHVPLVKCFASQLRYLL